MSELNDSSELQTYSSAVLYVVSAVTPPAEDIGMILNHFMDAIKSSTVTYYSVLRVPINLDPSFLVLADPIACSTPFAGFLSPKSSVNIPGRYPEGDGCFT